MISRKSLQLVLVSTPSMLGVIDTAGAGSLMTPGRWGTAPTIGTGFAIGAGDPFRFICYGRGRGALALVFEWRDPKLPQSFLVASRYR